MNQLNGEPGVNDYMAVFGTIWGAMTRDYGANASQPGMIVKPASINTLAIAGATIGVGALVAVLIYAKRSKRSNHG